MLAHDQMSIEVQAKAFTDVTEHKTSQEFVRNIRVSAAFCTRSNILVLMLVVGLAYQSALRARADENENAVKIMNAKRGRRNRFRLPHWSEWSGGFCARCLFYISGDQCEQRRSSHSTVGRRNSSQSSSSGRPSRGNYMAYRAAPSIPSTAVRHGCLVRSIEVLAG
jgi:hypothetical protein